MQKKILFYLGIFIIETFSEPPKNLFICLIWRPSQHWVFTDQIKIRVSDWVKKEPNNAVVCLLSSNIL